jgi:hypothetical protein
MEDVWVVWLRGKEFEDVVYSLFGLVCLVDQDINQFAQDIGVLRE